VSKPKTTPWFRASIKPVRKGWYQVRGSCFLDAGKGGIAIVMRHWNGSCWEWENKAGLLVSAGISPYQDEWRGLAAPPKNTSKP
jgi:hypothetical protein